jgi:flavin-dependent dehydrogenase
MGAPMLNVRRVTLDAILLDAAARAGAEVRPRTSVTGLVEDRGRVAGVRTSAGDLRAPLVVGADGVRSAVARLVGAGEYHRTRPGRVFLWSYYEGAAAPDETVWLGKLDDHAYLASPTDGGLFMVAVVPSIERHDALRRDRESGFAAGLRDWPELADTVAGARRVGPVRMMSKLHGFFRTSAGPGWALVGDAGHFKDPTPGQGIADALRQAEALAPAIERALGGGAGDAALREWWAWRDRDAWEMYWFAHDMGAPGPTPLVRREIQRRMANDLDLAHDLMRVLNHDLEPSKVFTPALGLRATAAALARAGGRRRAVLREARALVGDEVRRWTAQRSARV